MLTVFRPSFEVVKEGRILHLGIGYMSLVLVPLAYNEESSVVDKRFERSNLELIKDMVRIIKSEELLSIGK
jgi:hypothetical protein